MLFHWRVLFANRSRYKWWQRWDNVSCQTGVVFYQCIPKAKALDESPGGESNVTVCRHENDMLVQRRCNMQKTSKIESMHMMTGDITNTVM